MAIDYILDTGKKIDDISSILKSFVDSGAISTQEIVRMDELINVSLENQLAVLNDNSLQIWDQRILFGAIRNIKNTTKVMKNLLETANARKENPSTAEMCLLIIPHVKNLGQTLDDFFSKYKETGAKQKIKLEKIEISSRILHKKARDLGVYRSYLEEEKLISKEEMKKFIDDLNSELKINADIDEGSSENTG